MPTSDAVIYRRDDAVGVITLNRPDNRNSMTRELLAAFDAVMTRVLTDDARAIVITGAGKCFCAGADFRDVVQLGDAALLPHERSYAMYKPFLRVLDVAVPVIGALNGHTVGGGFGLALLCDIRIANRAAKYGANFARLGLHPGMAITYLLPRIAGDANAAHLLYTGELIDGDTANAMGIANEAAAEEDVLPRALELARTIANNAPIAVRMTKHSLRQRKREKILAAAADEAVAQAKTLDTSDAAEGMQAILAKRQPQFRGE